MAIVTKLWIDNERDPLNKATVQFNRDYLLDYFDLITQRTEFSRMTVGQLMPKRPKLADRRPKRRKAVPHPYQNELVILPTRNPPQYLYLNIF
jgi:hypothetical protein